MSCNRRSQETEPEGLLPHRFAATNGRVQHVQVEACEQKLTTGGSLDRAFFDRVAESPRPTPVQELKDPSLRQGCKDRDQRLSESHWAGPPDPAQGITGRDGRDEATELVLSIWESIGLVEDTRAASRSGPSTAA